MAKVSVIVPVYNGEKYIERCLNSVVSQTFRDFELIVVNDGSTDNTLKKLNLFKDKRLVIINKENGGVSSARNLGYSKSRGEYILFFDADDFMEKEMLETMVNDMEKNDVQAVRCNLYIYYENNKTKKEYHEYLFDERFSIIDNEQLLDDAISGKIMAFSPCMLFQKKKDNIRYNEKIKYMGDVIFYVTLLKDISKIYIEKKRLYNYVQNGDSVTKRQENIMNNILSFKLYREEVEKELRKQGFYTAKRMKLIDTRLTILMSDLLTQIDYKKINYKLAKEKFKKIFNNKEFISIIKNADMKKMRVYKKILIQLGKTRRYIILYYYIKLRKFLSKYKKLKVKINKQ